MSIDTMKFEFFAWAAARAAMAGSAKAKVSQFRKSLEDININYLVNSCTAPNTVEFDAWHRSAVLKFLDSLKSQGKDVSFGIGAKCINVYMKGFYYLDASYGGIASQFGHPPIDSILLSAIDNTYGTELKIFKWQKLSLADYTCVIGEIRRVYPRNEIWMIEELWKPA